ncbi:hypothetical protein DNTS_018090 [Danionella cerebrum]|uniref:Mediator of RNA polymerase II transcription subunit 1 n=1 Tax=Danionella cerebrum TaxID=2873325 RepID=A0A553QGW7_9TELE|nr:hypothetical protein DNTS_018090 [Danionella translucida]
MESKVIFQHLSIGPVSTKAKTLLSDLKSKFAEKSWNESMQLVRRCMEKTRDGRVCELIAECLRKVNEALNVSSMGAMVSRLEMISKQRGLGSHLSPTETVCYLTADLFYLEVLLLPDGAVEDVRVAHHGQPPVSSPSLLQLLRMKRFQEFSLKLKDLASFYNIPGESAEVKMKIFTALQHLETDLFKISHLPSLSQAPQLPQLCAFSPLSRSLRETDLHVDLIMNGRIGNVQPGREGAPLSIEYFISPLEVLARLSSSGADAAGGGRVALVTAGSTDAPHRLQTDSLIPSPPQLDSSGSPVFLPLSESGSTMLPATFLLKLQPPLPVLHSFIETMSELTGGVMAGEHQQKAPLPKLLMDTSRKLESGSSSGTDADHFHVVCFTPVEHLPDSECHSYVFSGADWNSWGARLLHAVPFLHPGHVPGLLNILRHQTAINVLLESCFGTSSKHTDTGSACELWCELLPDADHGFSVTFSLENSTQLAVLQVAVLDSRLVSCRLLIPDLPDHHLDEFISRVLRRCMSIPITMRVLRRKLSILRCRSTARSEPDPCSSASPASEECVVETLVSPAENLTAFSSSPALCSDESSTAAPVNASPGASLGSDWASGGLPHELH